MEESTTPNSAEGAPQDADKQLADTIASLQLIESLLDGDDKQKVPEISFELPLQEIMKLLPDGVIIGDPAGFEPDKAVTVTVDQLYKQLAKGKVTATVAQLVFGVPADIVKAEAFDDDKTIISIPLPTVVSALDPELLRSRTAQKSRVYATDNLPDPFKSVPQPSAKPQEGEGTTEEQVAVEHASEGGSTTAAEPELSEEPRAPEEVAPLLPKAEETASVEASAATPIVPQPVKEPEVSATDVEQDTKDDVDITVPVTPAPAIEHPTAAPSVAHDVSPTPPKLATPADQEPVTEPDELERLGGVNINLATINELLTLDGVTPAIAQSIVAYRTEHGPFKGIFDLYDVSRVGRKTFKSITGMPYNPRRTHRLAKLVRILKLPASGASHLPTIVKAVVERTGFAGCILSDDDGFVLAQTGADEIAESFSATVPRTLMQIRENMQVADIVGVDLISIGIADRMITVVASEKIFMTYIHKSKRLTKRQVLLVERIGDELAWLISHRGYAGQ